MRTRLICVLALSLACLSCSRQTSTNAVAIPSLDVLRGAVMRAAGTGLDANARNAIDLAVSNIAPARKTLLPVLEQCLVGPPVALIEWLDGTAYGIIALCEDGGSGRLVYLWARSSTWFLNSYDGRELLERGPMVTEVAQPMQLLLDAAGRRKASELLAQLPNVGAVFPDAAVAWEQWYWFSTWDGSSCQTVAVSPLGFDYVLAASETPDIVDVRRATKAFTGCATYLMELMYAHVKTSDPERLTDIPLPFRNYNRGGPMVSPVSESGGD